MAQRLNLGGVGTEMPFWEIGFHNVEVLVPRDNLKLIGVFRNGQHRESLHRLLDSWIIWFENFGNDTGASGSPHFNHNEPQEGLYGVWAYFHPSCDLLACKPLSQELHGLAFPLG